MSKYEKKNDKVIKNKHKKLVINILSIIELELMKN